MEAVHVQRLTAISGIAAGVLATLTVPLYFIYSGAPPAWNVLTRNLVSIVLSAFFIVFLAGLRRLIVAADPAYEWLASLVFGTGLTYVAINLVARALEVGVVLEHPDGSLDPTVDGPLAHASMLLHGSIARMLTALMLAAAGFAILRTRILAGWAGWSAYVVAAVNLAFVPSLFFGTDAAHFYSAVGWGNTALTGALVMYWVLAVSIATLARRAAPSGTDVATVSSAGVTTPT